MPQSTQSAPHRAPMRGSFPQPGAPKKKAGAATGALLVALIFLLVFAALFALMYFDVGGLKGRTASMLGLDTAVMAEADAQEQKALELEEKQKELDAGLEELNKLSALLESRQAAAEKKEEQLKAREQALESAAADIAELAALLENMDPDKAAAAVGGMTNISDIARLLVKMDRAKAAAVLDRLESKFATQILMQMMQNA